MVTTERSAHFVEQVQEAIELSPYLVRKQVQVATDQGRVVLDGEVETFFQKQMATEALRRVDGVETIDNRLRVSWIAQS